MTAWWPPDDHLPNFNQFLVNYLWLRSVYVISLKRALSSKHCVREINSKYVTTRFLHEDIYTYVYTYVLPLICWQNFQFFFEYFSKNSFRNELKAPFLLNFDTHDLTCKNFQFGRRGAQGGPRTLKKILWYLKIISTRVCKKIFLIKAKKKIFTCPPKI